MLFWETGAWGEILLTDEKLEEIRKNVPLMVSAEEISKSLKHKGLVDFFLENSLMSLNTAKILNEVSLKDPAKRQFNFLDGDFETYLWVINTSYYSMFYMAGALLAKINLKIKSDIGVHKKTFAAFVYYFYLTKKIAKQYLEDFDEAQQESQELLGVMQGKARELMAKYGFELGKRARFTYNIEEKAKSAKAQTSLKRAVEFYNECLRIMGKL